MGYPDHTMPPAKAPKCGDFLRAWPVGAVQYASAGGFPRIAAICALLEQFMLEVPGRQFRRFVMRNCTPNRTTSRTKMQRHRVTRGAAHCRT
ncbi:hypothetical protein [Cupriavidus lacunae]|uniref:Uncharacterized protein n=1 Tax=Cupriavidus lacunae TaxID=2666307 RepID=A0A370NU24_9BURK|nr:hypothetical protein [Cupriavidus lacunae]RDK09083.1 hypothetical protein DN412_16720 [Cupriavidus lacunae]